MTGGHILKHLTYADLPDPWRPVLVMDQGRLVGLIEAGDVNRFLAGRS